MNELLRILAKKLEGLSFGSKAIAGLVGLAMVAVVAVGAVASRKPHYELAFSGLSDHEVAEVNKALSEAGLAFDVSQPPSPFSVYVDRDQRSAAYRAVYGAGALDKPLKGILAESGVSSVFQGSEERLQSVRKREWQEMEGMLEVLDFVVSARVRTSTSDKSPMAGRKNAPMSASVTLRLTQGELSTAQSETVAQLVAKGLGIARSNIVISDQAGNRLYDGMEPDPMQEKVGDLLSHAERHDREATERANAVLTEILGPNKAHITVRSEWDYDQSTVRTETPTGKATLVSERKDTTETPVLSHVGGSAGIPAGAADEEGEGTTGEEVGAPEPLFSKTSKEDKQYQAALTTEERVRFMPTLERQSVAFFLDESLDQALTTQLEEAVKAAVGFVETRDAFRSVRLPFAVPTDAGVEGDAALEDAPVGPNPLLEMLLRRGIEIAVSLVFVLLLLKSLKGSRAAASSATPSPSDASKEIDPELLARARVDELLKADPEQVGSILSSWAKGEPVAGGRS